MIGLIPRDESTKAKPPSSVTSNNMQGNSTWQNVNNGTANYRQPIQPIQEEIPVLPGVNHPQVLMEQGSGFPMNLRPNGQPMINTTTRQAPTPPPGYKNGQFYGAASSSSGFDQVDKSQSNSGEKYEVNRYIQTPPGSQRKFWLTSGNFWYKNNKEKKEQSEESDENEPSTSTRKPLTLFLCTQGTSWRVGQEVPQSMQGVTNREYAELQQVLARDRYFNAIDSRSSSRMREQEDMAALSRLRDVQRWEALTRNSGDAPRNPNGRGF